MFCKNCGNKKNEGDKFCIKCGNRFNLTEKQEERKEQEDNKPTKVNETEYEGLGGWLALVGFGLIIGIVYNAYSAITYFPLFGQTYAIEGYSTALYYEFAQFAFLAIYGAYLLNLYFKKNVNFPKNFIYFMIAVPIFSIIDYLFLSSFSITDPEMQKGVSDALSQASTGIGRNIVVAIIWVSYMYKSRRVKATFIQNK